MYQALYRKWRPKAFEDVVGQEHITQTLRRQVAQDRLSHAYLFTGTRGTGKTTCAKILAKAVNCQHPVDGDPCNQCPACLGVDSGNLLDVLELDAASNNGVDHVRALRDEAIYAPANVRYRVYIIDEVHMLSPAAFNALLKIMEEPPAHLIFILATTELHKVPATILSRCQRFAFRRIRPQDIAARLAYVAGQEGMTLHPAAAELLSRLADGALRDALSLLDQCGAAAGDIDVDRVLDVLGLAGNLQTAQLMECVLRRDAQTALLQLDQLYSGGKDIGALLNELTTLTRDLLIRMTAPEGGAALLSGGYDSALMDRLSQNVPPTRLLFMASLLQSTAAGLALSPNRRTDAELCLLRLCDESLCGDVTALAARLSRLEAGSPVQTAAPLPTPVEAPPVPEKRLTAADRPPLPEEPPAPEQAPLSPVWEELPPLPEEPPEWDDRPPWDEPAPPPDPDPAPPTPPKSASAPHRRKVGVPKPPEQPRKSSGGTVWDDLSEHIRSRLSPMHQAMLDDASGTLEGDILVIRCGDDLTRDTLSDRKAAEIIRDTAGERLARPVTVRFLLADKSDPASSPESSPSPPPAPPVDQLEELIRLGAQYDIFQVK